MNQEQATPVWVVIPAAGLGQRMNSETPKQYLRIHNKTILEHTLQCFSDHSTIEGIVVVLNENDTYFDTLNLTAIPKPIHTTIGGENRSTSVLQGLQFLSNDLEISDNSWVMVHDAARPCLPKKDIDNLLSIRNEKSIGGILASPVRDTMKRASQDETNRSCVLTTESRDNLWHALTPQLFRVGLLKDALIYCNDKHLDVTDECSAVEFKGLKPEIVEGNPNNIKITYVDDIEIANFLLSKRMS